ADEEQSVRLGNCVLKLLDVARRESHLVERNRLAGCKNPHDDIFDTACRRYGRDTQFDVERAELLELDLSVLRLARLRNVEVAHDLDARRDRRAIACRHLDVGGEIAVLPEANLGLRLAWVRFDMNIRCALVIRVDDYLVDQLDEFVVGSRRSFITGTLVSNFVIQAGKKIVDVAGIDGFGAVELVEGLPEFALSGDFVDKAGLGKDVRRYARRADALRIEAEDDDALPSVIDRQPLVGFDVLAL